jgi:hypothetical protein
LTLEDEIKISSLFQVLQHLIEGEVVCVSGDSWHHERITYRIEDLTDLHRLLQ